MPFNLLNCVGVIVMSLIAGSMNKDFTYLPIFAAYYWTDSPLEAAFSAMVICFVFGSAIKLSKAWQ